MIYGAWGALGAVRVAWGIPPRAACSRWDHTDLPGDAEMHSSAMRGDGFGGDPRGLAAAKGAPNPRREVAAVAAAGQAQHHDCALARTQWPGPPGRETNFRSAPEGLFWTLCSA